MNRQFFICTSPYLRTSRSTHRIAIDLYSTLDRLGIIHCELEGTNDYWCRDYMPLSLFDDGSYVGYQYLPDYLADNPQTHKYLTNQLEVIRNNNLSNISDMGLVFDGGNYVRMGYKVIMTDKVIMENPYLPLHHLTDYLHQSLMADIIFLPWDMDDPCGHADGMVAPLPDGRLLLNNYRQTCKGRKKAYYNRLLKILEPNFDLVELSYDCKLEKDSWCYLNFLKVPGAVLLPCLSENVTCDNDQAAISQFAKLFPDDIIIPIYSKPLIRQGGALHCVTWEYYSGR